MGRRAMVHKPRVLFVSGECAPMRGGIGDYTAKLTLALVAAGIEPSLFVPAGSLSPGESVPIAGTFGRWCWGTLPELHRALVDTGADWLHVQHQVSGYRSHLSAYAFPRYLRWKRWPGRIAVTFHDTNPPWLFRRGARLWWEFSRTRVFGTLARDADVAIAADPAHVEELEDLGATVRQVPIGSAIGCHVPQAGDAERVRRRFGIPPTAVLIGHFGTPIGLETLLEALQSLPDSVLMLIGKQRELANKYHIEKLTAKLLTVIDELGIDQRLRWTDHLAEAQVAECMSACDVIVLPYEAGASLRHSGLMAAITQGKAVITSRRDRPLPGLVDGETVLMFPCGDATALAEAIGTVVGDPARRAALERNAAAAAREVFSWEAIAEAHRRIYLDQA